MRVIGQRNAAGQAAPLGHYLARDGSKGLPVEVDLDEPHVGIVVGKRGAGKSHTLAVLAEGVAATPGVGGVLIDPMGSLVELGEAEAIDIIAEPAVDPAVLPARSWCSLLDLDPAGGVGALVWRAAASTESIEGMLGWIRDAPATEEVRLAASNHVRLARDWGIFGDDGLDGAAFLDDRVQVLTLEHLDQAPANAVTRAVADGLFEATMDEGTAPLQWLFVDEAHVFFEGTAGPGLHRILTRGRHPGVSLVTATQRPSALPSVAVSQADLIVAHRLTAAADVEALGAARESYHHESIAERLPSGRGEALVLDDATESVHTVTVRDRWTPAGGSTPRASNRM